MEYIILIPIWLILCFLVSSLAKKKGRNGTEYFILAFIFSPLLALFFLLIAGDSDKKRLERVKQEEEIRTNIRTADTGKDINTISTSHKYENLEKLGGLLEKGIISKEEFEKEKNNILSNNISNTKTVEKLENKKSNSNELEIFRKINKEIDKAKSSFFGSFNQELLDILEKEYFDKAQTLSMLKKYEEQYNEDLVEKIKSTSSNYSTIKNYLSSFIDMGIIEPEYPHKRITTANKA